MKILKLPMFNSQITLYSGVGEFKKFKASASKQGYDLSDEDGDITENLGLSYGQMIWVGAETNATLLHETIHVVDELMETHGFEGSEFRAYMVCYIFDKFKYN